MARTVDNHSMPAGDGWPLLSELLDFVSKCLHSEIAAKEFLLDYFDREPIEWIFDQCDISPPKRTPMPGSVTPFAEPAPLESQSQDIGRIDPQNGMVAERFFWWGRDMGAHYDVDWAASAATYDGPLIEVASLEDFYAGKQVVPRFNGNWWVRIRFTLIHINAAAIVERLLFLKRLPSAAVVASSSSPLAPEPPPSPPEPPAAQGSPSEARKWQPKKAKTWLEAIVKSHPQKPREKKSEWSKRLYEIMKTDFENPPWTSSDSLNRRLSQLRSGK